MDTYSGPGSNPSVESVAHPGLRKATLKLRGLAVYQILAAGIFITIVISQFASGVGIQNSLSGLLTLLALAPIAVTAFAGVNLYRLSPIGSTLSYISFALQIPIIYGPAFSYDSYTGMRLEIGYLNDAQSAGALFGYSYVGIARNDAFGLGVNVFAVLLLWLLNRWQKQYDDARAYIQ